MQTKRDSILPSCFYRSDMKGFLFKPQLARIESILRAMNKRNSCFHLVCLGAKDPRRAVQVLIEKF